MADIDRTYEGAVKEIMRLSDKISDLRRENKFLTEMWYAVAKERNDLKLEVARLKQKLSNSTPVADSPGHEWNGPRDRMFENR